MSSDRPYQTGTSSSQQQPSTPRDSPPARPMAVGRRMSATSTPSMDNKSAARPSQNWLTGLHQVSTIPHTPPDSSPMSPSMNPAFSNGNVSLYSTRSTATSNAAATSCTSATAIKARNSLVGSPTLCYGSSFSVSALGFESGYNDTARVGDRNNNHGSSTSTSSSDDDDESIPNVMMTYDSDERLSNSSRRPSVSSSVNGAKDNESYTPFSSISFKDKLTKAEEKKNNNQEENTPAIRHVQSNVKALRPKAKNFLRISRDLQEEMAPLDYEIKRESEITNALREYDDETDPRQAYILPHQPGTNGYEEYDKTTLHSKANVFRDSYMNDTDDSDAVAPSSPKAPMALKRKAAIVDESMDSNTLKRRAVSPGIGSPSSTSSSTTNIGSKHNSLKQVQDTSDGFQNMSL